jgi:hypothetical protein
VRGGILDNLTQGFTLVHRQIRSRITVVCAEVCICRQMLEFLTSHLLRTVQAAQVEV